MRKTFERFLLLGCIALGAVQVKAQSLADMQQDFALIRREVGNLRLEVEQLRRENDALKQKVSAIESSSAGADLVKAQVSGARAEMNAKNEALKKEIIEQVKKEMESMARQTNANMQKLASAIDSRPQAAMPVSFSDDYPKTGIPYVVQSGDTLGKIARKYSSQVRWIQDANKIADPNRGLRVGDKIFIPQK